MPDHPKDLLLRQLNGYRASYALHVAAVLGLADLLAGGARTSDDLSADTGTDTGALYRLLRALAALGVLEETDGRTFELTATGALLRGDSPESLRGWAIFIGSEGHRQGWSGLEHSVRTGETAFEHHYGVDVWTYREQHPDAGAVFDAAMESITRGLEEAILAAYDFGRFRCIVDVGGNRGALVGALLGAHRDARAVVFDLPHVVAEAEPYLRSLGVLDRVELAGGSFFEAVPADGDAYVLKWILHDWDDDRAASILRRCAEAMDPHGAVLVVEQDLGPPNENPAAKLVDLQMLVGPGGRERSRDEYAELFAAAGLQLAGVVPVRGGWAIYEARR